MNLSNLFLMSLLQSHVFPDHGALDIYLVLVEHVQCTSYCVYNGCTMVNKTNVDPIIMELIGQLGRQT